MSNSMKEKKNIGFTLAELLIVVAIIALLIAISIPVFTLQVEKAREATDLANIRAAIELVSERSLDTEVRTSVKTGEEYTEVYNKENKYTIWVKITQKKDDWQNYSSKTLNIAGNDITVNTTNDHWVVVFDSNNQKYSITESK